MRRDDSPEYLEKPDLPFRLWLRFLAVQKLFQLHRRHFGVQARDLDREISIHSPPQPEATSALLAAHLLGKQTSPSMAAMRVEASIKLEKAINSLNDMDREILALRRFERLSNDEAANLAGSCPYGRQAIVTFER